MAYLYWLTSGTLLLSLNSDRLWIQRQLPSSHSLKRKRSQKTDSKHIATWIDSEWKNRCSRQRIFPEPKGLAALSPVARPTEDRLRKAGIGAATKTPAKKKVDVKDIYRKQVNISDRGSSAKFEQQRSRRPMGTRVSARLRADIVEEGWQSVPEEWLTGHTKTTNPNVAQGKPPDPGEGDAKKGLEGDCDSISDLTELSSDDQHLNPVTADPSSISATPEPASDDYRDVVHGGFQTPPADFVEWETVRAYDILSYPFNST